MDNIHIRPFKWGKDYKKLFKVASEVWFFDSKKSVSFLSTTAFMLHYLNNATSLLVAADKDDNFLGLLGLTNKVDRPALRKNRFICCRARVMEHAARMLLYVWPGARNSRLIEGLFVDNHTRLRKMVPDSSAPEVLVIIVNTAAKGMGVGQKLIEAVEEQLRNQGFKSYYLITDSSCDFGFYDHIGMKRAVDVSMSFNICHIPEFNHGNNGFLRGYVYTKELGQAPFPAAAKAAAPAAAATADSKSNDGSGQGSTGK